MAGQHPRSRRGSRARAVAVAASLVLPAVADIAPGMALARALSPGVHRQTSGATCGDGTVDAGESCDLGSENGQPGSDCTSDCRIVGRCTVSRAPCETSDQCPAGEGCCGNGVVEAGEDCDDGNLFDLDCCSRLCRQEPAGSPGLCDDGSTACTSAVDCGGAVCHRDCQPQVCAAVGPHLVPAAVGRTIVRDRDGDGIGERWSTKGRFTLRPGETIAPDGEPVELVFSQGGTLLYDATLAPGDFSSVPFECPRVWKFRDPKADLPGAIGWKSGRLRQDQFFAGSCSNVILFRFLSGANAMVTPPSGTRIRQSIRVGDDCATAVLGCTGTADGRQVLCLPVAP